MNSFFFLFISGVWTTKQNQVSPKEPVSSRQLKMCKNQAWKSKNSSGTVSVQCRTFIVEILGIPGILQRLKKQAVFLQVFLRRVFTFLENRLMFWKICSIPPTYDPEAQFSTSHGTSNSTSEIPNSKHALLPNQDTKSFENRKISSIYLKKDKMLFSQLFSTTNTPQSNENSSSTTNPNNTEPNFSFRPSESNNETTSGTFPGVQFKPDNDSTQITHEYSDVHISSQNQISSQTIPSSTQNTNSTTKSNIQTTQQRCGKWLGGYTTCAHLNTVLYYSTISI